MKDITGTISNNLQVIGFSHRTINGHVYTYFWKVKCLICGEEEVMQRSNIFRKTQKACGCLRRWTKKRFINFVNNLPTTEEGCKEYPRFVRNNGYAGVHFEGKSWSAHRLSFYLFNGIDPADKYVCHSCDNRKCINQDHLWLGTATDNMQDCSLKGRTLIGSRNPASILNESRVLYARKCIKENTKNYQEIADELNVSYACVWDAVNRSWGHI